MEDLDSGHNIRATVFLECREMYRAEGPPELRSLGETQFVAGVSAMSESGKYGAAHACAGIIGNVDFRVGSRAKGILEQHIILSGGRFRGIRNGATWHSDPSLRVFTSGSGEGLYVDRAWREGFAALAPLNLTFEAWMFHSPARRPGRPRRAPSRETKIVLNHIGGALAVGPYADKRKEVFEEWRTQINKLGQFPNVYIKLGGLGMPSLMGFEMGQQDSAPSSEQLAQAWRPYIETCIAAFGPDRGCSRAISRSTRECAAIPICGTPSSASPRTIRMTKRMRCSTTPR